MEQIRSGVFRPSEPLPSVEGGCRPLWRKPDDRAPGSALALRIGCDLQPAGQGDIHLPGKVEKNLRRVLSFTEEMKIRGSMSRSRVLSLRLVAPDRKLRKILESSAREKVYRLHRVRIADRVPLGVECSWIPAASCPDLPEVFELNASLYRTLAEHYGIQISTASEVMEVGKVSAEEAPLLRIAPRTPVLLFTRTSFLESGKPAEYVRSTFRGDRYRIVYRLNRLNAVLPGSSAGL